MYKQELAHLEKQHLLRQLTTLDASSGPYVTIKGKKLLLMCSNDYLGLASHPALSNAACAAIEQYGFGSGSSRLVSGNSKLHEELEQRIAQFKGTEAALLFNSGYAANTGVIPALAGEGGLILSDSLNHASIIDGCRLSRAQVQVYEHRDVGKVESILKKCISARRKLIVTDGVFSMDGDLAPLPELVFLAEKYNAILMVDDAHATGVIGKSGRGSAEYFGLSNRIPIQMGTLSKALGSFGAYVAGSRALIDYLVNKARSLIYSTALPPAVCAASLAALDVIEREPELRERLWANRTQYMNGLISCGLPFGPSETPIIPIIVGDSSKTLKVSEKLFEHGIYATAIRPPTVPEGAARIRTTIMALHSSDDLNHAISVFNTLKKEGYL